MAVEVGISHMTLLIVTLAFSLVNICLIIATGGIIYNWQDRFMGPVLKCDQPKWTSDGKDSGKVRTGLVYSQNNAVYGNNNNMNGNSNWGVSVNAGSWGGSATVNGGSWNGNNNNNNNNVYTTTSWSYAMGVVGSSQWSSWKDNQWSTCPYVEYPRWSSWTQPTQTWNTWTQPSTWNTWTQPSTWVSWTQPTAWVAWTQPVATWATWNQPTSWTGTVVVGK